MSNRYSYSKGHPSHQAATEAMEAMLKAGEIAPHQYPKVVPYSPARHTILYAIDLLR